MSKSVPVPTPTRNPSNSLDLERDAIRELPASDWLRMWATLRARCLPRALATELQLSIAEICVQSFTYISALAALAAIIITVGLVPAGTAVGKIWIAIHILDYLMTLVAARSLRQHRAAGTLSAARVNATLFVPVVTAGALWGTLPAVVGAEQVEWFYLAMNVSVPICVIGCFWPLGHWPLSMSFAGTLIGCVTASFWFSGLHEAPVVTMLAPVFLAILFVLTNLASVALVHARYYELSAREREQLIGLMLQDYERGGQDFLWEADTSMRLTHVPQRMITAGRGDPNISLGASLADLLADQPEALAAVKANAPFHALITTNGPNGVGELRLWGRPKTVSGRPMGYRGVGADEAAARLAAEAERNSERLDAMVTLTSGLAHDFNNQLATVLGSVELAALEPGLPERAGSYLQRAIDACLRTRRITADLVVASGFDGSYQPAPFAVFEALGEVIDDIAPLYPTVSLTLKGDPNVWVNADRSHFLRAAQNLMQNACQAIVEAGLDGGKVTTTVEGTNESPPMVRTSIIDNGPGVEAEVASRIFEPFTTSRRSRGGTGLGLSVARGFARQSSGTLRLITTTHGAAFELAMPRAEAPAEEIADTTQTTRTRPDATRLAGRFVIVEDDPAVAENILAWIDSVGGVGETVGTVAEAIERYAGATRGVECVICDLALPDGEGFEVIAALRDAHPELQAIYMSGFTRTLPFSVDARLRCPFVAKPFSTDELVDALLSAGVAISRHPPLDDDQHPVDTLADAADRSSHL